MANSPLHIAIALLLSTVYAIVGGTGTSLHYLLGDLASAERSTAGKPQQRQGYMHCHGPDYHWHYHSWEVSEEETEADEGPPVTGTPRYHALRYPHQPHACPALVVVATLKLGVGRVEVLSSDRQAGLFLAHLHQTRRSRQSQPPHLPRGPPLSDLA